MPTTLLRFCFINALSTQWALVNFDVVEYHEQRGAAAAAAPVRRSALAQRRIMCVALIGVCCDAARSSSYRQCRASSVRLHLDLLSHCRCVLRSRTSHCRRLYSTHRILGLVSVGYVASVDVVVQAWRSQVRVVACLFATYLPSC
jgi:hypothetical protein